MALIGLEVMSERAEKEKKESERELEKESERFLCVCVSLCLRETLLSVHGGDSAAQITSSCQTRVLRLMVIKPC